MAMGKKSAGLLMYRKKGRALELFLVHPGGPYWAKKDLGAWTIPKGEISEPEEPFQAAKREFQEETGFPVPEEALFLKLTPLKQRSGKVIHAWAFEGDSVPETLVSNTCTLQWPPSSGKFIEVPEVDRGGWFKIPEAKERIIAGQRGFIEELEEKLTTL
jgi:predicted NUDIX family NTP pyrophosphohydrolase